MMRRSLLIALVLCLMGACAAVPSARAAQPLSSQPSYPLTATSAIDVTMPDGTALYVEVTRPHPGAYGNGPWPVILEASPYHGTLADRKGTRVFPDPVDAARRPIGLTGYFAPRGYAVVMVDLRGTGRSGGCLDHLGANDAADLKAIVEWAAGRPWSNGRVGMIGHSYVAATAIVAAAQKPTGLVTIVPSAGLASMYDHQFNRGVPWFLQWVGPMEAYEQLALQRHAPGEDNFGGDVESTGCGIPQSSLFAGPGQLTGQYSDWHEARDWSAEASAVDIPVFIIHGVHDNAARIPAAEWFFGTRFERPGDKVWIGQWDHGAAGNTECRVAHPTCRFEEYQHAVHAWFDRHLAGRDVDTGPGVEVFLSDGTKLARDAWREPRSTVTIVPDASDGSLRIGSAPSSAGAATFGTVADVVAAGVGGTVASFRSPPLTAAMTLLGLPAMTLEVSLSYGQVVDVVTTLWREDASGERHPVSYCGIQPQLRNGVDTVTPVVPDEVMTLEPQCFTMAQDLHAGDRLVLEVGTTSSHHASRGSDAQMTLHTGPQTATRYTLPLG